MPPKMTRIVSLVVMSVALIAFAGCGKDKSKSVAGGSAAIFSKAFGGSGSSSRIALGQAYETAKSQLWLARFSAEAQANATDSCSTSGTVLAGDGVACTATCPSDHAFNLACTMSKEYKATCNGTEFTYNNGSINLGMDFARLQAEHIISVSMDFALDIKGGDLDGGKLACKFAFSGDITKTDAAFTPDCGNFSCSYAGDEISCDAMKDAFKDQKSCS